MSGNIAEWCYDPHPNALFKRHIRGSSYGSNALGQYLGLTYQLEPDTTSGGFRLCQKED